ncbi:hypothetical protein CXB51_033307 [Gossypium anomalum]|uniref:WRKY domain-containing protein n=1 Tax=Gossypium anomalum TaxID=47600 RepID=A0A8J6CL60_9ROSI|nr:hypothetical protein CXB51_033307 [Gossypium anomalum]
MMALVGGNMDKKTFWEQNIRGFFFFLDTVLGCQHVKVWCVCVYMCVWLNLSYGFKWVTCRGYYRCTHRNVQGCLATKQVQRSDDDPTIFDVAYRGRHTCSNNNQEQGNSTIEPYQQQQHIGNQTYPLLPNYISLNIKVENDVGDGNYETGNLSPTSSCPNPTGVMNNCSTSVAIESEFTEIIQAATSAMNAPTVGLDFPFGNAGLDPNFTFDDHGFFS